MDADVKGWQAKFVFISGNKGFGAGQIEDADVANDQGTPKANRDYFISMGAI